MPTATVTVSADRIAFVAQQTWNIPVTGKDVRGLARGDTGVALLPRFAERNADGTNRVHQYDVREAGVIVRALHARKSRRVTGLDVSKVLKTLGLPLTGPNVAKATKSTSTKTKAAKAAQPAKTATVNRALGQRAISVKPAVTTLSDATNVEQTA